MKEHSVVALVDESVINHPTSQEQQLAGYLLASSLLHTLKEELASENIEYMQFSDLEIIGMAKKAPKKSEEEEDFDFDEDEFELEDFDFEDDFEEDFDDLDFLDDEEEDYDDDYF